MNFCLVPWRSVWIQIVHEADEVVCHVSRAERIREVARVYLERQRHGSPISGLVFSDMHSQHRESECPLGHTLRTGW